MDLLLKIKFKISSKITNFDKLVLASMTSDKFPLFKDVTDDVNAILVNVAFFRGGMEVGVGIL